MMIQTLSNLFIIVKYDQHTRILIKYRLTKNIKPLWFHCLLFLSNKLIFEDARIRDAGSYVCLAQNSAGTALLEVDVSVLIPPKISIPHRFTATAGSPFTMKPETVRGLPGPTFSWRKDGEKLFSDKYRNVDETIGRLIFVVLEPEDSGRYVIKAENKAGFDEVEVLLTVLEKPKISVIGKDVDRPLEITKGEDFSLMLNLVGSPRPQVQ